MIVVLDTSISDVGIYIKDGRKVVIKSEELRVKSEKVEEVDSQQT